MPVVMNKNITALERAFQIAKSGTCETVTELKKQMKIEGFSDTQLEGRALSKQLVGLMRAARQ